MSREKYQVAVRFNDLDSLGHVNYAVYLNYLEDALNRIWMKVLSQIHQKFDVRYPGIVTARTEIDYRASAVYNHNLEVEVWVSAIGNTSFTAQYRIVEKKTGSLVAEAKTVQVITIAGEKEKRMPEEIRALLRCFSDG
jgi:acyl-CoA thioester hydrolase